MRSSPQDVVLWAHTVQALGIGGWESCGAALTSPAWSVVCKGKIPDSKAEVFHMTKTIICLYPRSLLICQTGIFFSFWPFYRGTKTVQHLNEQKSACSESQLM